MSNESGAADLSGLPSAQTDVVDEGAIDDTEFHGGFSAQEFDEAEVVPSDEVEEEEKGQPAVSAPEDMPPLTLETAFVVYPDHTGHWTADSTLINRPLIVGREANHNDFFIAAATIQKDVTAFEIANRTVAAQQAAAAAMAQAMQSQNVAQEMARRGITPAGAVDLSTLPNRQQRRHPGR
jgi:hypothetical protein